MDPLLDETKNRPREEGAVKWGILANVFNFIACFTLGVFLLSLHDKSDWKIMMMFSAVDSFFWGIVYLGFAICGCTGLQSKIRRAIYEQLQEQKEAQAQKDWNAAKKKAEEANQKFDQKPPEKYTRDMPLCSCDDAGPTFGTLLGLIIGPVAVILGLLLNWFVAWWGGSAVWDFWFNDEKGTVYGQYGYSLVIFGVLVFVVNVICSVKYRGTALGGGGMDAPMNKPMISIHDRQHGIAAQKIKQAQEKGEDVRTLVFSQAKITEADGGKNGEGKKVDLLDPKNVLV